ncbi:hypothetical protein PAXINDRAFT_87261 [Paxillus involutus ATCC 200175]|uniref:Uncharacterized protein n=1 Tax=Paxillus involutus ATCC 200175 TaxID=664439 RepID=A0A0C9TR01_PAXIN|nr:hypothetical protein PAXINDRAFT_87261 [Paxillus involutus ATCC 200175]
MPKVASHWTFHRYFSPLTGQSVFPPERAISPPPLTQHKVFPRDVTLAVEALNSQPVTSVAAATQRRALICKPRGEVSRINRGGYNLQDKLSWPVAEYEKIQVSAHLTVRKSWVKQSKEQLQIVFEKSKARYPLLQEYEGGWVVSDFLRVYLKNICGRGN